MADPTTETSAQPSDKEIADYVESGALSQYKNPDLQARYQAYIGISGATEEEKNRMRSARVQMYEASAENIYAAGQAEGGLMTRTQEGTYIILVDKSYSAADKAAVAAHEYGHVAIESATGDLHGDMAPRDSESAADIIATKMGYGDLYIDQMRRVYDPMAGGISHRTFPEREAIIRETQRTEPTLPPATAPAEPATATQTPPATETSPTATAPSAPAASSTTQSPAPAAPASPPASTPTEPPCAATDTTAPAGDETAQTPTTPSTTSAGGATEPAAPAETEVAPAEVSSPAPSTPAEPTAPAEAATEPERKTQAQIEAGHAEYQAATRVSDAAGLAFAHGKGPDATPRGAGQERGAALG